MEANSAGAKPAEAILAEEEKVEKLEVAAKHVVAMSLPRFPPQNLKRRGPLPHRRTHTSAFQNRTCTPRRIEEHRTRCSTERGDGIGRIAQLCEGALCRWRSEWLALQTANAACTSMSAGKGTPSSCFTVAGDEVAVSRNLFPTTSILGWSYLDMPCARPGEKVRGGKEKRPVAKSGRRKTSVSYIVLRRSP